MIADIKEKLLKVGKSEGSISYAYLNDLIPDGIFDPATMEKILDFLSENDIEVVTQKQKDRNNNDVESETVEPEGKEKEKTASVKEEPHEIEETTTTYLREMGRFDLLTPEEEEKYSKTIRQGFDAIIRAIRKDVSSTPEMTILTKRIELWEKRDPSLKPKKQHLNFLRRSVENACEKYQNYKSLQNIHSNIEIYTISIEAAKDAMIKANLR
ncbi:MAG: RNA polymerase subunit sigma, partial [Desulfobulbaceae bacterium]|nr:RNA polymerase subunit sigma [Desulfobulbaceae bacterium]